MSVFRNMNLKTKLLCAFGIVAAIAFILGAHGFFGASKCACVIDELGTQRLVGVESLLTIKSSADQVGRSLSVLLIPGLSAEERSQEYRRIEAIGDRYEQARQSYASLPKTDEEGALWEQLKVEWGSWHAAIGTFIELSRKFDALGIVDPSELGRYIEQFSKDHYVMLHRVRELLDNPQNSFDGGEDHTACNAGLFFKEFKTGSLNMAKLLEEFHDPHQRFHAAVRQIKQLAVGENNSEAETVFKNQMVAVVPEIFGAFDGMRTTANEAIGFLKQATEQGFGPVLQYQREAMALVDRIVEINRTNAALHTREALERAQLQKTISLALVLSCMLLSLTLGIVVSRSIARPIVQAAEVSKRLSKGDLTMQIEWRDQDEVGRLLEAMQLMVKNLRGVMEQIVTGVRTLSNSSGELSMISEAMSRSALETADKTNGVASASGQTSANLNSIAEAIEQSASNTQIVAAGAEEMTATIGEIARKTDRARIISDQAAHEAVSVSDKMAQLDNSAREIGKVVETISDISDQVNLLALNATIEAVRAGEGGKGFVVVANEIKELARQTAVATQEISHKINGIQGAAAVTITAIESITRIVTEISEVITGISAAVQQQSAATNEIAANISQAAEGIRQINLNVGQSTIAVAQISQDIAMLSDAANGMSTNSVEVNQSALDLATLAGDLKNMTDQFIIASAKETIQISPRIRDNAPPANQN